MAFGSNNTPVIDHENPWRSPRESGGIASSSLVCHAQDLDLPPLVCSVLRPFRRRVGSNRYRSNLLSWASDPSCPKVRHLMAMGAGGVEGQEYDWPRREELDLPPTLVRSFESEEGVANLYPHPIR